MKRRKRGSKKLKAPEEGDHILKLPSHITIEILSSLPVKTIAHCACVCKAWRTLLSDPCFPRTHLAKSPVNLMLFSPYSCWLVEFEKDFSKRKVSRFKDEHVHRGGSEPRPYVVGCCNGLLCLSMDTSFQELYVWNPVKNYCITLPVPNMNPGRFHYYEAAFGFCPRSNVYKVIRMVRSWDNASSNKAMCEVYTLGTDARWRTIEDVPVPYYRLTICKMPLNAAVHWFCNFMINDEKFPVWLCAFRIEDEKWDPILLPLSLLEGLVFESTGQHRRQLDLKSELEVGVLEKCLAIFDKSEDSLLNIWMMKDYGVRDSWIRCWSIEQTQISAEVHVPSLLPLKLTKDGELLLFDDYNTALVCFDPEKRLITRKQRVYGVRRHGRGISIAYVASFISPTQVMNEWC